MKQFALLTVGFEKPTKEIMEKWNKWFESIGDRIVGKPAGLMNGKEISKNGTQDLPMDLNAVTGYLVINAENMDEALKLASENPYITSIRVYEVMTH